MNNEEQRQKIMRLAEEATKQEDVNPLSPFLQAQVFANEEVEELTNELEKIMKKFENSEIFMIFGKKYIETILSNKESFVKVINKDISEEEFNALDSEQKSQVKRQQKKRRELLERIAKAYNLI